MTLNLTNKWTYRLRLYSQFKIHSYSLQAYSQDKHKWVHIAYIKVNQVKDAEARYLETMRFTPSQPAHLNFSINTLIELKRINIQYPRPSVTDMLTEVCHILDINLEIT